MDHKGAQKTPAGVAKFQEGATKRYEMAIGLNVVRNLDNCQAGQKHVILKQVWVMELSAFDTRLKNRALTARTPASTTTMGEGIIVEGLTQAQVRIQAAFQ